MSKNVSPPIAAPPTEVEKAQEAARQSLKGHALRTEDEEEFDAVLEMLVGKQPSRLTAEYMDRARPASKALREFIANGPYAQRPQKTALVNRALALARKMQRTSVSLSETMDAFLAEFGEYAEGPVLYGGKETEGHLLFRISFFGLDERALDPGAPVPKHQKTSFRLEALQEYGRLIGDSIISNKGRTRNLEFREKGRRQGRLVLAAADMILGAAPPHEITGTVTGPFMEFCFALLALAKRPAREERRLRDFVEYGAPRIREIQQRLEEADSFDAEVARRRGLDHPYFKTWIRIFELRREISQGPPPDKKGRRAEAKDV